MKVVIDDKIPFIREAAQWLFGDISLLPGGMFAGRPEVADADALIVRTRTACNAHLLADTKVTFIATATIGFDHLDTVWLNRAGIAWANCPGCNAASVAQYVRNAILQYLKATRPYLYCTTNIVSPSLPIPHEYAPCVGIVGYGHVGRAVRRALEEIGCRVLLNDPPLEAAGATDEKFVSLQTIAERCDIITFHTPLTRTAPYPTWHLADSTFFQSLRRKPLIINAARGGVVDEASLLHAYEQELVSAMAIDTWEGEPDINLRLLEQAAIATPHIAGYSADGKSNATRMALRAVCRHFRIAIPDEELFLRLTAPPPLPPALQAASGDFMADALSLYDPLADTARLKAHPDQFEALRGNYPLRRETRA